MKDLVSKIISGDERAFEYIKNEWNLRLNIFARSYVRSDDVSKDLVQDTYIKFWEARSVVNNETMIGPYLFTILKNKCLDYLKHKIIEQKYNDVASESYYWKANIYALEDKSINIIAEEQIQKALFNAIKKLPQPRKDIFIMSRFREMKNAEIANRMSLSVKTIEYHITKAMSFLRNELEDYFIFIIFF
jgi:RNA polymerase sigma-70 factor (ECF subfamily)